jgi:hypothetical protein
MEQHEPGTLRRKPGFALRLATRAMNRRSTSGRPRHLWTRAETGLQRREGMLLVIKNLREIAQLARTGGALPPELGLWLERSLREFLDHRCHSLDEAVGLRFAKGGVPWWLEEGMRARDSALRELAARFLGGLSTTARAARIHTWSERYAAANWPADRVQEEMPRNYAGTAKEWLWRAFKSGAPMPLGERRLRSILADADRIPDGPGLTGASRPDK